MASKKKRNNERMGEVLAALSGSRHIMSIPKIYCEFMGSLSGGAFLSETIYWSDRGAKDRDGWFWRGYDQWKAESYLSGHLVRKYADHCARLGFLEWKQEKVGKKPYLHYRIDMEAFMVCIAQFIEDRTPPSIEIVKHRRGPRVTADPLTTPLPLEGLEAGAIGDEEDGDIPVFLKFEKPPVFQKFKKPFFKNLKNRFLKIEKTYKQLLYYNSYDPTHIVSNGGKIVTLRLSLEESLEIAIDGAAIDAWHDAVCDSVEDLLGAWSSIITGGNLSRRPNFVDDYLLPARAILETCGYNVFLAVALIDEQYGIMIADGKTPFRLAVMAPLVGAVINRADRGYVEVRQETAVNGDAEALDFAAYNYEDVELAY